MELHQFSTDYTQRNQNIERPLEPLIPWVGSENFYKELLSLYIALYSAPKLIRANVHWAPAAKVILKTKAHDKCAKIISLLKIDASNLK